MAHRRVAVGLALHDDDMHALQQPIDGGAGQEVVLEERSHSSIARFDEMIIDRSVRTISSRA